MEIQGKRVRLRDRGEDDLDDTKRWFAAGAEWRHWDAPWETLVWDEQRERRWREVVENAQRSPEAPRTSLEIETADGRHIGWVGSYWVDPGSGWRDAGIVIAEPDEWGEGRGREAFTLWTDYLMRAHELPRIGMGTWSGNVRMIHLAARVGMHEEARFREARDVRGERYDAVRWGMTRTEWLHHGEGRREGFRPFVRDDWDEAAELIRQLYDHHRSLQRAEAFSLPEARETLFEWRHRHNNVLWVWQQEGHLRALARARHEGIYFMEELVVAQDHRGQGLGSRMLAAIEDELRAAGETDLFLSMVWPGNLRALDLYRRRGYDLINTIELRKGLREDRRGRATEFLRRSFHLGRSVPED